METVDYLLIDTQNLLGIPTAGDRAFLKTLKGEILFAFLEEFRDRLLQSVEDGMWVGSPYQFVNQYAGLDTSRLKAGALNFMRSAVAMVFDLRTSRMLTFPSTDAFRCLYQVASFLDKFGSGDVSDSMRQRALAQYRADEESLHGLTLEGQIEVLDIARQIVERHFLAYLPLHGERARHGPGAVSEGSLPPWEKYRFNPHADLDVYWPHIRLRNSKKTNFATKPDESRTSRLCFVPKSRKKCRIICAEPSLLQYLQQGLRGPLYEAIQRSHVGFDLYDQTVNGTVARESSAHGYYATLDLRSASDLLSLDLVGALFPTPMFARFAACRSERTRVVAQDGDEYIDLLKFGSMGNALTFPVQSIVFFALLVAARMLSGEREMEAVSDTWVYGDDIIVPSSTVAAVHQILEACGLRVNMNKSFWRGRFRESCGVHAFQGVSVTPVYLRSWSLDPESLVSQCAAARQLDALGYRATAESIYKRVEAAVGHGLPFSQRAEGLARFPGVYATISELCQLNKAAGITVRRNAYQQLVVPTSDLRINGVKRRRAVFDNSWDMWDYIGPHSGTSDRDRGIVANGTHLVHVMLPLSLE